jgi:hypothetical protein
MPYVAGMTEHMFQHKRGWKKVFGQNFATGIPNYACFYNLLSKEHLLMQFQPVFLQCTKVRNFLRSGASNSFRN